MVTYRRDIDGLRALAVLPVVGFHAAPSLVPGGFVGVDIFFVISGFLITSILVDQHERGSFTLIGFYERRVRRILPALGACVAVSAVAASVLLPPGEMADFGKSLVSVVLFSSNVFFWRQGGYFAGPALDKPLLHTWSLSVEEQFYLAWPLLLAFLFATRFRKRIDIVLVVLGALSLASAALIMRRDPEAAFYLAPPRAWELALGAFLAVTATAPIPSRSVREIASGVGFAAIVASIFAYSSETPFPGAAALLPCGGAALIIYGNRGGDTLVGRWLSLEPIVFIGLISYSLYLWHWPILVFSQIGLNRALMPAETAVAVVAIFVAAILSWRYVETPFRRPREPGLASPVVLRNAFAFLTMLGAVGVAAFVSGGFQFRANAATQRAEASVDSINPLRGDCHVDGLSSVLPPLAPCISGPAISGSYQVLVWGDSHADHLVPAIAGWAARQGLATRQATKSACRPLLPESGTLPELYVSADCAAFNQAVIAEAAKHPDLDAVILSGFWANKDGDPRAAEDEFRRTLERTVAELRRRLDRRVRIIIVGTTPVFDFEPPSCLARALLRGQEKSRCTIARPINEDQAKSFDPIIREVAARDGNAVAIVPWQSLCTSGGCVTEKSGAFLYRDHSHFTVAGSRIVLEPLLAGVAAVAAAPASPAARLHPVGLAIQ